MLHILGILPLRSLQLAEGEPVGRAGMMSAFPKLRCLLQGSSQVPQHGEEEAARVQEGLSGVTVSVTIFSEKFAFVWRMKSVCGLCWTNIIPSAHGNLAQRDTNTCSKAKLS